MSWETQGFALLSASIFRPFALAAGAGAILRLFRVRHPASRHAVWTAVLIGTLLLPFVSVVTPHWNVPVLPRKLDPPAPIRAAALPLTPPPISSPKPLNSVALQVPPVERRLTVEALIVWCYLAGFLAMFAYRFAGWVLLRRVVSRSKRLRTPWLRESRDVVSPVTVGVLRPVALLPIGWRDWSRETRSAVLAHEFAHLRRNDPLVASLARFLKCVLWFHPLAWWISRRISELAELSCDAAALENVGDPAGYSRVLLQFAGGVNRAGYRVALPGLAMADASGLANRIDQVFELSAGGMRRLAWPGAVLAVLGVPAVCLAATVGLGEYGTLLKFPPAPFLPQVKTQPAQTTSQTESQAGIVKPPAPPDRNALKPRFETASIEIAGPPVSGELCWGGCGGPLSPYPESRNQITYRHFTLKKILLRAYDVKAYQIVGPDLIDTAVYNVDATAAPGTPQEEFQLMLRNLLTERLQLVVHQETRDFISSYELAAVNDVARSQESQAAENIPVPNLPSRPGYIWIPIGGGNYMGVPEGSAMPTNYALSSSVNSVRDLTLLLQALLDCPIDDKTGLTGKFDIDLAKFVPSSIFKDPKPHAGRHAEEPPFYTALRSGLEQMGLMLIEKRTPTDLLIVDHVDSAPAGK